MEVPPSSRLQSMLQTAVQTVQWTYSLFWQLCPDQQGMLVWGEGYYNGAIKTRKTVQPMEVSSEEASLQRSQQLMELYESLSAGESNQQTRRPCASLSPEDLTELEWFYLMCVSFSFPPGVGLPGKAYAKRQHIWLTGANEVDSKVFTRAILAKTVVCIPLLDGVVELGTTETVQEDIGFIQQVKSFFSDHHPPQPPKPAVSEQSTSNPAASSGHPRFDSPPVPLPAMYAPMDPLPIANQIDNEEDDDEEKEEEEDQDEEDSEADSGAHQNPHDLSPGLAEAEPVAVEPSELMQVEMSEDIRVGSPDDGSNNLDWEFRVLAVSQAGNPADNQRRAESTRRWQVLQDRLNNGLQLPPPSGGPALEELAQEDTHYSQTVSTVLHHQPNRWSETSSSSMNPSYLLYSSQSSFSKWTIHSSDQHHHHTAEASSQWLLKYILFNVPFLHTKSPDQNSPKSINIADSTSRFPKPTPQDDLSANHVLAERRRREKLNERFVILRSLVPFVTKMDKASILGDTIEYVKQLRKKILDLEARAREIEIDPEISDLNLKEPREKRKLRIVEVNGGGGKATKAVDSESPPPPPQAVVGVAVQVQVSIIESDALVEMQCLHREGLLLEMMVVLRDLRLEVTAVQSSLANGVFVAELRAKVKQNVSGKKPSIVEVKRAMHQIIPQN
ncbi:hypothetical protein HYC85_013878 [Camellia sinensis]|uniref:BHLH domain-containing protein n=1 Tax=Camellia sinensis TaxID=4442 RepID=A0A7J7H6N8_CAMSI|nr:hypothetical protein HYC85_013878 [Camellia sinensis]